VGLAHTPLAHAKTTRRDPEADPADRYEVAAYSLCIYLLAGVCGSM